MWTEESVTAIIVNWRVRYSFGPVSLSGSVLWGVECACSLRFRCSYPVKQHNAANPFTPKSDQCQISPAASPQILRNTVNLAFHNLLMQQRKDDYTTNSHYLIIHFSKGVGECTFRTWGELFKCSNSSRQTLKHLQWNVVICRVK